MNEMEMMQLSKLLNVLVGEPPRRVTVGAVRRKVAMRRLIAGATATATAAFAVSAGLVISAHALGKHPVPTAKPRITEPRYYFEEAFGPRGGPQQEVVRSTATGTITARVSCPGRDPYLSAVAAAGGEKFFLACLQDNPQGVTTGTKIYRFALTRSGRVTGFGLETGGNLSGLRVGALAASPDGAELAAGVAPARSDSITHHLSDIVVINTRTGKHALWHAGHLRGGIRFSFWNLSFARNGGVLAVFGWGRCPMPPACKSPIQEMIAVSHPGAGGQIANGRVLFTRSSLTSNRHTWIDEAFITPDGATATAVVSPSSGRAGSSVVQISTATGKLSGVLYRSSRNLAISPDPSGRFILATTDSLKHPIFGWIDHGKLAPLRPADKVVFMEAW